MNTANATISELPTDTFVSSANFRLDSLALCFGGVARNIEFRYAVYGDLNKPCVLVLGGISANCFPFDGVNNEGDVNGWWQSLLAGPAKHAKAKVKSIGPQSAFGCEDNCLTNIESLLSQYCVIGVEFWAAEAAQKSLKISTFDQAELISKLLDALHISCLHRIIGSSYGGMVALAFCQRFSARVKQGIVLCAADKAHARSTASRVLQRRIVEQSITTNTVHQGLALARSLAMLSYRGASEIEQRFANQIDPENGDSHLPIEGYFNYHGERFAQRFDPYRFLNLSQSIDLHKVNPEQIIHPLTLIGFEGDQVVPPEQMTSMQKRLAAASPDREVSFTEIKTPFGHDGFLKETEQLRPIIAAALR